MNLEVSSVRFYVDEVSVAIDLLFFFVFITLGREMSDTKVYEP